MAGVSYLVVRAYVADRRPQVRAKAGREPTTEAFVPQSHRPGAALIDCPPTPGNDPEHGKVRGGEVSRGITGSPVDRTRTAELAVSS